MGCALYIRWALSIHQKECRKSLGCALYIGARYLPENTVFAPVFKLLSCCEFVLIFGGIPPSSESYVPTFWTLNIGHVDKKDKWGEQGYHPDTKIQNI
jgi:hypothetical protein